MPPVQCSEITTDQSQAITARMGFVIVVDAFHMLQTGESRLRLFVDERSGSTREIRLTEDHFRLVDRYQSRNLPEEIGER